MSPRCPKCDAEFSTNQKLQRHLDRTRPCDPVLVGGPTGRYDCDRCGRGYSRSDSLARHKKKCRPDPTTEKAAFERALRNQKVDFDRELAKRDSLMADLASRLESLAPRDAAAVAATATSTAAASTSTAVEAAAVAAAVETRDEGLISFDHEDRARMTVEAVLAAFSENPTLVEYVSMHDALRQDLDTAAPYVLEALVELIRRAHRDPACRNVFLNPNRADQVLACGTIGSALRWEARPLSGAIRHLFDGVADGLRRLIIRDEGRRIPFDVQTSAAWVSNLYDRDPDRFARAGWSPVSAHLTNARCEFNILALVVPTAASRSAGRPAADT